MRQKDTTHAWCAWIGVPLFSYNRGYLFHCPQSYCPQTSSIYPTVISMRQRDTPGMWCAWVSIEKRRFNLRAYLSDWAQNCPTERNPNNWSLIRSKHIAPRLCLMVADISLCSCLCVQSCLNDASTGVDYFDFSFTSRTESVESSQAPQLPSGSVTRQPSAPPTSAGASALLNAPSKTAGGNTRDVEDSEDTMKNLRKTFAGIFGDM